MEIILLVAFVAMVVLFAARAAQNQRAVVRVPARFSQPRARREQHNHRDECYEKYNFHDLAPSSLLGATARQALQRTRIV